ncbi:unnamed protein product [Rotaria sordida]|uniref:Suppressor of forked domain-containing protein n=1 Tax=Rotaria sordida TaxID=392033 RepID=A0A818JK65_9BILA|nr:unnamed protein product [Rotaria sordida]
MHVPDSITVGPNRSSVPRLHIDDDRLPVRMEVPNSIRLAGHSNAEMPHGTDFSKATDPHHSLSSTTQQTSFHPLDVEPLNDDDYTKIDRPDYNQQHQPIKIADSWHIEPFTELDDKQVLNKLQLLQNRIHRIERTLARRDFRDRFVYTFIIGYILLQALFSDLTRSEKIQQARKILNENKHSLDAWSILIQDAQDKKITESREFYESLITQFPTCGKFWKIYIESELFQRCLIKVLNIDLWKCYLNYVRDTKGKLSSFREKMAQAYDFALEKIGMDVYSYNIWNDYIIFLKSVEAVGSDAENKKITAVRKVYQKGIMTPMTNVELLWKDYCTYEMGINPMLGKKIIDERSREFLNVKRVTKEFETLVRTIDRNIPCIPPTIPQTADEIKQITAWRKFISWERLNPLKTEDILLVVRRVVLAYEQCLLCLGYHADLWYEVCAYLEQTSHGYSERGDAQLSKRFLDDAAILYERAIQTYMRSNMLIHFAYADFEEQRLNIDKARSIYNRLLDINEANLKDPTLAYIQAMRFERRTDGIKSARTLFKRAREDIRTNHQIYVAAALMEYYCTKDNNIAFNIFNLGLKKYNQNLDYILAYIDYMTHLNEDHNARVLFERILSPNNSIFKQLQPTIWNEFLKFESQVGDLQSIKKVEKRRLKIYSDLNELEGRETLLLVDRYKFLNLLPCSIDELKLLGCKDLSNINLSSTNTSVLTNGSIVNGTTLLEQAVRDRRAILPRPDIKHMMPFRPTRKPLPGSHPTPGGAFPLPDTALYLVKVLPPARNFEGPFVIIDELMERVTRITIPDSFDPIRFSIQGEVIRDLDSSNTNTSQQNRKTGHGDSDDEEQQAPLNVSERSTMDIYRQRQQKRVKLTKTNSTDQLQSLQRIATMTCFEDLSGEILMIIFEYMDVEDLWTIFFNMNTRFNTLVFDSRLRLTANISKIDKTKFDQFCLSLFQTNCNNIFILILSNNYYRYPQIRQFLFHTTFMYFQSLYSLILIDINYDELMKITNQIKQLSNLNHLHVNTHEIYHDKQLMNITQELFNQPNIHVLGLDFHEKIQWYDIKTISLSNIEVLSLNFINIDRLFLLLPYCPHLRSLSMTLDSRCNSLITNDNSESLSQSTITYPQITSLRFYFRSFNISALQRLLNALPSLKRFSIDTLMYKEDYIRASFWTLLLQQRLPLLERVRLVLRGFFGLESNEKINENRKNFIGGYQYDQYWLDRAHKKIFTCYTNDTSMVLQIR